MNEQKEFLLMNALKFKYSGSNGLDVFDAISGEEIGDVSKQVQIKNVCAKLAVPLSDELDEVVAILGVSKRLFIENAIVAAIQSFHEIAEEHNIFAPHTPASFTEEK